jgi:hypothetical protein
MLYSDVAEGNVGKPLTLETLAKAQGIVGAAWVPPSLFWW